MKQLSVRNLCFIALALFATASITTFFLELPSPAVQRLVYTILWTAFMASELMVFWGIHQFERSRSDLFQVPTLMLVICVGVNILINVVECGLLIGSHFFDSLKCTELLYALSEAIGQLDLYYILASINAVALVWLGYAMSHRGVVWFLPALLATTQVVTAFILSFAEHGEALKEFNKILYYATWPIFYSALAWYYSKVAYKTPREE